MSTAGRQKENCSAAREGFAIEVASLKLWYLCAPSKSSCFARKHRWCCLAAGNIAPEDITEEGKKKGRTPVRRAAWQQVRNPP
eukprot:scaffold1621_cov150-Pinguiococcus_pyrenoidosus.AAC.6